MQHQGDLAETMVEIGIRFGLSRPAGQCFAAIWASAQAPCADDLTAGLGLSRSNVSTALKELREWGLVSRARAPGDRKEYFVAPRDPWDIARQVAATRWRRDLAPLFDRLRATEPAHPPAAALIDAAAAIADHFAGLASMGGADFARAMGAAAEGADPPAKKKKKKRRKDA